MGVSNGVLITAQNGVSIADVESVIGTGGHDLGTLCKKNTINMWAKYRPFLANKKKNNAVYFLGLTNGSATGSPNPSAEGYGNALSVNYYGNSGALDDDENYRYDKAAALGITALGSQSTQLGITPVYFNENTKKIANIAWNIKTSGTFDPKFYRLTDFNGYYHNAKPREMCYFSDTICKGHFGIIISATSTSDAYKEYCLSSTFLFDSSAQDYVHYTLGILFTEEDEEYPDSMLINTRAAIGYSTDYAGGTNGILSNKAGANSSKFWVVDKNGGGGGSVTSYIMRDSTGYVTTTSTNPMWVLVKAGGSEVQIFMYPENFPNGYNNWFKEGHKYTVQLVMINGGYVAASSQFYKNIYFDDPQYHHPTYSNLLYNPNIYSLDLARDCYCMKGLTYSTITSVNKIYYDIDGNTYNNDSPQPPVILKPTYDIVSYTATIVSNNLTCTTAGQSSAYGETYKIWSFGNKYDSYSIIKISISISNYTVPRNGQGVSVDNGTTLYVPELIVDASNVSDYFVVRNSYTSSFKPVSFSDLFENEAYSDEIYVDSTMLTFNGISYFGTVEIEYKFKFKNNKREPAWNTRSSYTSNSSYLQLYFDFDPTKKITLYIP